MTFQSLERSMSTSALNTDYLPREALYGAGETVGWQLSQTPFCLTSQQHSELIQLGKALYQFVLATEKLVRYSEKGVLPQWVARLYEQGKPEELIRFSKMNSFKKHMPLVIRPDLLLTDTGWALCELDSVPGGLGFTAALNQAYRLSGFPVLESPSALPIDFLQMLLGFWSTHKQSKTVPHPVITVVLSDEAQDYLSEMSWLVAEIRHTYPDIHLIHPNQVMMSPNNLIFKTDEGEEKPIHLIYRFFELFDLPNIPQIELIQYAIKKGLVLCTPPFKPYHEEKLTLALFHHPVLTRFWLENMDEEAYKILKKAIPQGWVLDPTPLPPQGLIPNFTPKGIPAQSFEEGLLGLTQKQRELVIKPSGFSPMAWGSRGVTVGHDVSGEIWQESVKSALNSFSFTPHVLQVFQNTSISEITMLYQENQDSIEQKTNSTVSPFVMKVRTRLCPYFFVTHSPQREHGASSAEMPQLELVGVLATSCPIDKKVIHGMKDAVLAPCMVLDHGELD